MRRRIDKELVRRGLARDGDEASALVVAGRVLVGGAPVANVARQVDSGEAVVVTDPPSPYVGRGAYKLEAALDAFDLNPAGCRTLDAGASTGGFTDLLLQRGATAVVALDVGHNQLHERLRGDPRVEVLEHTNLRHIDAGVLGPFDAVVADLSFISLTTVMEVLVDCTRPGGWLVVLVKPQFEAPRDAADRGRGVISDPGEWRRAIERVVAAVEAAGAVVRGLVPSPLLGGAGNVEFLLYLRPDTGNGHRADVDPSASGIAGVAGIGTLDAVLDAALDAAGRTAAGRTVAEGTT